MSTDVIAETRTTVNIIADTRTGNKDKVIVVGAHLDSVLAGPGINDNGSGTATILETAIQMKKLKIQPRQQVRFAFWGAEELGLLGSEN
ncbi:M20/M25/M40 family metallo-hydrolase [Cryobacterium sp. Hz9]|uniref:M20/M25/M40 family metallo-hydrolase n=1 Tax=Cryobacterium sp. Hz9 TaxID=1259167 RepID=UPI0018E066F3|nr:M20/M25/M40 family metallo-hydrolase [Cryobacterium sp. Hz9]